MPGTFAIGWRVRSGGANAFVSELRTAGGSLALRVLRTAPVDMANAVFRSVQAHPYPHLCRPCLGTALHHYRVGYAPSEPPPSK